MLNFKKNGKTKEQRKEEKRVNAFVREKIYPLLVERSKNVNDLTAIVKGAKIALENELTKRVQNYHYELDKTKFSDLHIKALEGNRDKDEQDLLDALGEETLKTADFILTRWPAIIEHFIKVEMQQRSPDTLTVNFE